ncbi:MAG: glycogen synthase GlgA [Acidobacteriaceae bacterium]|nr:glycogen synthase GlgA [Acidobacteriaceae bacterium]
MVASEATPFCKTGGLADVVGSLPAALQRRGEQVGVVLPAYRVNQYPAPLREVYRYLPVSIGKGYNADIYECVLRGVPFFFVDCPELYDRPGIYNENNVDYPDNHMRFAVLSRAALEISRRLFRAEIVHCHDWQTGPVPVYLRQFFYADPTFLGVKTLFTIHNLGYQGYTPASAIRDIGFDIRGFHAAGYEMHGQINLLKAGIQYSDAVSTVSPRYAREIQTPEYGFALDPYLRARANRLTGIVNGVDYAEWSPETDTHIPVNYSINDLSGKAVCKRDLLAEMNLPPDTIDRPLIGIVSRFADQKGFDLIADVAHALAALDLSMAVLGSGDARYEDLFRYLASTYPTKFAARIGYDNGLAHRIEAGSDMFLMPSRYEPCGLNQIYSLRYGTLPIVRATGGLDDTIEEGTGFKFWDAAGWALLSAVEYALGVYRDRERWTGMMETAMLKDFSWDASAADYSALYRRLRAS